MQRIEGIQNKEQPHKAERARKHVGEPPKAKYICFQSSDHYPSWHGAIRLQLLSLRATYCKQWAYTDRDEQCRGMGGLERDREFNGICTNLRPKTSEVFCLCFVFFPPQFIALTLLLNKLVLDSERTAAQRLRQAPEEILEDLDTEAMRLPKGPLNLNSMELGRVDGPDGPDCCEDSFWDLSNEEFAVGSDAWIWGVYVSNCEYVELNGDNSDGLPCRAGKIWKKEHPRPHCWHVLMSRHGTPSRRFKNFIRRSWWMDTSMPRRTRVLQ